MIANAAMDIWEAEGVGPIVKYEDDVSVFRIPTAEIPGADGSSSHYTYPYDRSSAVERISSLNIPWHPGKGQDFDTVFKYIGFLWRIDEKSVSLPDEKRIKFLNRVRTFLASFSSGRCSVDDVMKIHGSLCHITYVYPHGRNRLASLSTFISRFNDNRYRRLYPPSSVISDLRWWNNTLSIEGTSRSLVPLGPPVNLNLFVDASTSWGIGIYLDGKWDAWSILPNWKGPCRDIGWLEGVGLEFTIYVLEELGFSNAHITIYSDNKGVIGAFDKGRCRNFKINSSIRRSSNVLASKNILLNLVHVESEANLADPISRGILGSPESRLCTQFNIPDDIKSFFLHV